jgi:hypothetical protein
MYVCVCNPWKRSQKNRYLQQCCVCHRLTIRTVILYILSTEVASSVAAARGVSYMRYGSNKNETKKKKKKKSTTETHNTNVVHTVLSTHNA